MSVLAIPQHCGQAMTIVQSKMKCLGCGYEMPVPGEAGLGDKPPMH